MLKIGIIKEYKIPSDNRAPLSPDDCKFILQNYDDIQIIAEPSDIRCFKDNEYKKSGVEISNNMEQCDVLLGIKEVPIDKLISYKTFMFFSHTYKMQEYNRELLKAVIEKKIKLIDYELLKDKNNNRLIGFGRFAGIVGAYYALIMAAKKFNSAEILPAWQLGSFEKVISVCKDLKIKNLKIALTGFGRAGKGAKEILEISGFKYISPNDFLKKKYKETVYTHLAAKDLCIHKTKKIFDKSHFYKHPVEYKSAFTPFTKKADILINAMYWDNEAPRLFLEKDTQSKEFNIKIISDITCDIKGSVPINLKHTSTKDPVYGYYPVTANIGKAYSKKSIDIMAINNLPNELPQDASKEFSKMFINSVLPELLNEKSPIIERATIASNGNLTELFSYLKLFAGNKNIN